ncbi:MAG TPA: hypothetical protein VGW78_05035 [Candidatus Babeliales bacterium]|jgi:hypothetical protein|nr:hypothetical protein [Candidatus Babeliales bacterium]
MLIFSLFLLSIHCCQAQYYTEEQYTKIDAILFSGHTPVVSTSQLRFIPAETKINFDKNNIQNLLYTVIQEKKAKKEELRRLIDYDEHTYIENQTQTRLQKTISGLFHACSRFLYGYKGYADVQDEMFDTKMHAFNTISAQLKRLEKIYIEQKANYILSGRDVAFLAQHKNTSNNPLYDPVNSYFDVFSEYKHKYNQQNIDNNIKKIQYGKMYTTISYHPIQCDYKVHYSSVAYSVLPYITRCERHAYCYDGFGRRDFKFAANSDDFDDDKPYSCFMNDPRYKPDIHGPYGAIFLKSPHEKGYNNTIKGENNTWIRRITQDETLLDTCNRYLNIKHKTTDKDYFDDDALIE